jgi:hypothetical protein
MLYVAIPGVARFEYRLSHWEFPNYAVISDESSNNKDLRETLLS